MRLSTTFHHLITQTSMGGHFFFAVVVLGWSADVFSVLPEHDLQISEGRE